MALAIDLSRQRQNKQKQKQKQRTIFYTTVLLLSTFAAYSVVRPIFHHVESGSPSNILAQRSLEAQDLECHLVHHYKDDQCAFIRANCPDEEPGLISYLQLYYCYLPKAKPVTLTFLILWASLLFSTIGIAASDFLCINLSTIAAVLGMSESLTGVTFLAFGNGSPDVFSTFAAMSTNSGSLAVGELVGAAGFITAVVAGSMALVKPFQVARKSFIRDVGFFSVAASFSLVFLSDGSLRLWECSAMVIFYVFYVVFVVLWHWWLQRSRRVRLAETAARSQHHIPNQQELDFPQYEDDEESRPAGERTSLLRSESGASVPSIRTLDTPAWKTQDAEEDDETRDRYLAELQSNMRVSRPSGRDRRNTATPIRPSLIGALEFRSILNALEKRSTDSPSIHLRRYSDDASRFLDEPQRSRFGTSQPQLPTRDANGESVGPPENSNATRNRAVSASNVEALRVDPEFLSALDATPQTTIYRPHSLSEHRRSQSEQGRSSDNYPSVPSPQMCLSPTPMSPSVGASMSPSPSYAQKNGFLAPPNAQLRQSSQQSAVASPVLSPDVPMLQVPDPGHRKSARARYRDSTSLTPTHSRPPSIRLPPPSLAPESHGNLALLANEAEEEEEEEEIKIYSWWPYRYLPAPHILCSTLFPTLWGWRNKNFLDKILGIVTAPTVFLLTITLPVVEPTEDSSDQLDPPVSPVLQAAGGQKSSYTTSEVPAMQSANGGGGGALSNSINGNLIRDLDDIAESEPSGDNTSGAPVQTREWSRWLLILQVFTAPLFVAFILWANIYEDHRIMPLIVFVTISIAFSLVCFLVILATTSPDHEPRYRPIFCFLGFIVAISWIATIANEVVGVLKAFGIIFNISDAILGLTIFAVGNSLGDLVADITVAKLGYPVMALSACFGGPMLNILLGIGIGGMYQTIRAGQHHHHKHPQKPIKYKPYELDVSVTLMISGVTLLVTLLGLLIFVPLNGWRMDRRVGTGLITLWVLSTIGNVIVEIMGIGKEWEQELALRRR